MKRIFQLVSLIAVLIVSAANPVFAQLSEVSVGPVQTVEIDRHGICKVVKNLNPNNALYVPSMSRDEWVNFLSVPPWREVSECAKCSGYARDGYCFYGGAEYQTCNSVCSAHGGVDANGMNRLMDRVATVRGIQAAPDLFGGELVLAGGSPGAVKHYYCAKIAQVVLGAPVTVYASLGASGRNYGCFTAFYGSTFYVNLDSGWNGAVTSTIDRARNVCACNR